MWLNNPSPRHIPWGNKNWKRNMYPIVHCSTIYNSLEKETATHSSILAWRIPGMEEPGGLPSMGSHACIGEINGNPLYYSCLGNSGDGGAWWAAIWKQPIMSINRWIDKEVVVHIHNGILLSHKKEHIWVSSNEVDEPRTYYTEWSGSERER